MKPDPPEPTPSKSGRRTKMNTIMRLKIMDALMNGQTRREASEAAGIHPSTFYSWIQKFPDFEALVQEAETLGASQRKLRLWYRHPFRGRRPPRRGRGIHRFPKPRYIIKK